ncbi:MAG TPA: tetratricopeptide repeat protein [Thermoanaerobaculia bacterium]|nr:tetratricopeptide repeat protein [Thermoanaerobaculia bacterium]
MDVHALIAEAESALLEGDYDRAQRAAEQVVERRYSYGFDLLARVHAYRNNLPRAIAVLQEGVAKAPRAWQLWNLLGEYRSEHGDPDGALAAYDAALAIEGVDADEVHINAAIAHDRAGRAEDALMRLHEVRGASDDCAIAAARVRAEILNAMERPDAAAAAANAGLARVTDDSAAADVAPLFAALAKAEWMKGDQESALHHAWDAVGMDAADECALWLIREIEGEYSTSAKYFRILIHGRDEGFDADGFWRKYDVVADDEDEALRFILRVEPEHIRSSLRIDEADVIDAASDQPKGVYWCTGYAFYREAHE